MYGWQLHVRVENTCSRGVCEVLQRRRQERRGLRAGGRHFIREATAQASVGDGLATRRGHQGTVGAGERGVTGKGLAWNRGGYRSHLEAVDGIEGLAVARTNHGAGQAARCPGDTQTGCKSPVVVVLVPAVCLNKRDQPFAAVNVLVGNIDTVARFCRRRIHFPADTITEGDVLTELVLVLRVEVVLFHALTLCPKRHLLAAAEGLEGVIDHVTKEHLSQTGRDAQQVIVGALQAVEVNGCDSGEGSCGQTRRHPGGARERDSRYQARATYVTALVIVLVHADVRADMDDVATIQVAQILDDLGRIHRPEGPGVRRVIDGGVIEGEAGSIREQGVRFALREQELPAGVTECQFIDETRREDGAETEREVLRRAEDFTARRIAGDHDGTAIERVSVERVLFGSQPAEEHIVLAVDGVVHAEHVLRATNLRGGIPGVTAHVQTVAGGTVVVRSRVAAEDFLHCRIHANAAGVTGEHVVGCHAIPVRG